MGIQFNFIPVKLQGLLTDFVCGQIRADFLMSCADLDHPPVTRLPYVGVRGMIAYALPTVAAYFEYTAEERVASNAN